MEGNLRFAKSPNHSTKRKESASGRRSAGGIFHSGRAAQTERAEPKIPENGHVSFDRQDWTRNEGKTFPRSTRIFQEHAASTSNRMTPCHRDAILEPSLRASQYNDLAERLKTIPAPASFDAVVRCQVPEKSLSECGPALEGSYRESSFSGLGGEVSVPRIVRCASSSIARQSSKVGAVYGSAARTVLCGGDQ
jgi:hypothetical protein